MRGVSGQNKPTITEKPMDVTVSENESAVFEARISGSVYENDVLWYHRYSLTLF